MLHIQCVKSHVKKANNQFSQFLIGPLKKGEGITLGNAIRRTLLSNLETIAIVGVNFTGINHEFSTIPNVKEDIIEILLNIKQIVLKGEIQEPLIVRLSSQGPGIISAEDIKLPEDIKIIEPRQYIASLVSDTSFEMEFLIGRGEGYTLNGNNSNSLTEGFLPIDAIFMPVRKVNFFIETSSDDISLQTESLILDVLTDGSVSPTEAISLAADLLQQKFESLKMTNVPRKVLPVVEEELDSDSTDQELGKVLIEELQLSVRAYNCLKRANIHTVSDLLKYSQEDLLEFKNFGQKSADEVNDNLQRRFGQRLRKQ
jgi:DNA-directed RNA polymerase subunit alpha